MIASIALMAVLMQQPVVESQTKHHLCVADKCWDEPDTVVLTCPKYQHVVPAHDEDCSGGTLAYCRFTVAAACADDMHEVTEKEWQELMQRLKKLEAGHVAATCKQIGNILECSGDINLEPAQ